LGRLPSRDKKLFGS